MAERDVATATRDGVTVESNYQTREELESELAPPPDADAPPPGTADPPPAEGDSAPAAARGKPRHDPRARVEQATAQAAEAKRLAAERERELAETRAETARLRAELEAARRAPAAATPPTAEAAKPESVVPPWKKYQQLPGAPKLADFEGSETPFEDFTAAASYFMTRVQAAEAAQQSQYQQHIAAERERDIAFSKKLAGVDLSKVDQRFLTTELASRLPPGKTPTFGNWLVDQIADSDSPGPLMLHFTEHPDDIQRLAALPTERERLRELAKLDARLGSPAAAPSTGPAAIPQASRARPPIQPVQGSAQQSGDEPPGDDASDEQHDAYWRKFRAKYR